MILAALALAAAPPALARGRGLDGEQAAAAFTRLKSLVGDWRNADDPGSPLRFSLTAGGTVLVEEWRRGTEPHSLTLYHRTATPCWRPITARKATRRA